MTAYLASPSIGSVTSFSFGLMPSSTFQVKLEKVEATVVGTGTNSAFSTYSVSVYPSSSISGGTTITPFALRKGAASSLTTVKSGGTISGTSVLLHEAYQAQSLGSNVTQPQAYTNINDVFTPGNDLIIGSGSTLMVNASASTAGILYLGIYFEELHLARSV